MILVQPCGALKLVSSSDVIMDIVNRRKGIIVGSDQEGDDAVVLAHVSIYPTLWLGLVVFA